MSFERLPGNEPALANWIDRASRHVNRFRAFYLPTPAVLALAAVIAYPMAYNVYVSFHDWTLTNPFGSTFVGVQNYVRMLEDPRFWAGMWRMVYFVVGALVVEVVLGTLLAIFLNREFGGKNVVRTIYIFPFAATPVAIALIWGIMFNPDLGVLNYLLESVGLPPSLWISSARLVIPSLILVDAWQWTPLVMIIVLAGLQSLPSEPYESAMIDGASGWQIFSHITLPLIRTTIVVAAMLRAIDAIKTFDLIYVLTQGGPGDASETLYIYTYKTVFEYFHMGYGATLIMFVFIFVLLFNLGLARVRR